MLHPHYFGFFDRAAAARGALEVVAPLDEELAATLLGSVATAQKKGIWYIEQDRFFLHKGCLVVWDFIRSKAAGDFAVAFVRRTGCEILFLEAGQFSTPEQFADYLVRSREMREERLRRSRSAKQ